MSRRPPSARLYRALIRLLPARLRLRHGAEMEDLFAEELRQAHAHGALAAVGIWLGLLSDLAGAWPREWRRRQRTRQRFGLPQQERRIMIGSDIRHAFRSLSRQKGATALVTLMLTLGIAANVAVFSMVNALFLRPFPFEEPERLVFINEKAPKWNLEMTGVNFPDFHHWRQGQQLFEGIALWVTQSLNLADGASAERIDGAAVTHEFAGVMRLTPVLGRMFTADEDTPNGNAVTVISYSLWQERFGGDPNVLGRTLKLNGRLHSIIGVMPPEAEAYPGNVRLWVPLQGDPTAQGQNYSFNGIGRLEPGVTVEQAEADLLRAHQPTYEAHDPDRIVSPFVLPLREMSVRDFRTAATTLTIAVTLLLFVACANVAAVMLARALSRRREMGIRVSLGAGRLRLLRQLLLENLAVALAGGVIGLVLGQWAIRALVALLPEAPPAWAQPSFDARVMLFAFGSSAATVLIFGWAPALHAIRGDLRGAMSNVANAAAATASGGRTLRVIIGAEFALATLLIISGGLLLRAYDRVRDVDPGFEPRGVLTFTVSLPSTVYPAPERLPFWDRLEARMALLPGVRSVGLVNCPPFGCHQGSFYIADGAAARTPDEGNPVVLNRYASPGYFEAMGIRLKSGRLFEPRDGRGGPEAERIVIINETLARVFFPGVQDPVGRRIRATGADQPWSRIVGVVADVKHYGLERPMRPGVYWPISQFTPQTLAVALKTDGNPDALTNEARAALQELDPELPLFRVRTMETALAQTLATRTAYSWLLGVFALTALVLALGGAYGVSSYLVSQRTREIGIRVALGARRADIVRGVLRTSLIVATVGITAGVAASFGAGGLLEGLLFGVQPYDAPTIALSIGLLIGTAVIANLVPARRAARVDPVRSLRAD